MTAFPKTLATILAVAVMAVSGLCALGGYAAQRPTVDSRSRSAYSTLSCIDGRTITTDGITALVRRVCRLGVDG